MKIAILTLPSNENLAIGEGRPSNFAQWKIGQELKDCDLEKVHPESSV
jgi:hypothetical protein